MSGRIDLARVRIILHRPRYPENIGAAARAVCNMGIGRLAVVQPENPAEDRIRMLATHAAGHVVDRMAAFDSLVTPYMLTLMLVAAFLSTLFATWGYLRRKAIDIIRAI